MAVYGSILPLSGPSEPTVESPPCTVIVLSEDYPGGLPSRPVRRPLGRWSPAPSRGTRRPGVVRGGVAVAGVVCATALATLLWMTASGPVMAALVPWRGTVPDLATGTSYSVTIAALGSRDEADRTAARVQLAGFPVFTRRSPGEDRVYQTMVGPYASLDEARAAQRALGGVGFLQSRLFVDGTLQASAGVIPDDASGSHAVRLLSAPDRLSLVFERPSSSGRVNSRRTTASTYDIDLGPLPRGMRPRQWMAPDGVHLVEAVSLAGVAGDDGTEYLRARVELPEFASTTLRAEGGLVYLDLTWAANDDESLAHAAWPAARAQVAAPAPEMEPAMTAAAEPGPAAPVDDPQEDQAYLDAVVPLHDRLSEIRPFLVSAAQSDDPAVLAALDQTLLAVEAAIAALEVPADHRPQHELLASAIRLARGGLDPAFTGDREALSSRVVAMLDGAMAPSFTPEAP